MNYKRSSIEELKNKEYAIIGNGGFTKQIIEKINKKGINGPTAIVDSNETHHAKNLPDILVIGSGVFQNEITMRWHGELRKSQIFIDLYDQISFEKYSIKDNMEDSNGSKGNFLFCYTAPSYIEANYLRSFRLYIESQGYGWKNIHPLEKISDENLKNTVATIIWNGSTEIYKKIIKKFKNTKITYAESGFFPQAEHFYFDKKGVNLNSQIRNDDLRWLNINHLQEADEKRIKLFEKRESKDAGYIFVPLQIGSDTNIQNHSNFTNGMQEYIDFIISNHPSEKIIFKPHPKDSNSKKYNYHNAQTSTDDTLDLIASSSLVRGINSSVLFESALFGKKTIIDGKSLLNCSKVDQKLVIAAMIARQHSISSHRFDLEKISRFSNLTKFLK